MVAGLRERPTGGWSRLPDAEHRGRLSRGSAEPSRSTPRCPDIVWCGHLSCLVQEHGRPAALLTDNGPEFTSRALEAWAYRTRCKLHFIQPGKPMQNAFVESFNGQVPRRVPQRALVRQPGRGSRPRSKSGGSTTTKCVRTARSDDLTPQEYAARLVSFQAPPAPSSPPVGERKRTGTETMTARKRGSPQRHAPNADRARFAASLHSRPSTTVIHNSGCRRGPPRQPLTPRIMDRASTRFGPARARAASKPISAVSSGRRSATSARTASSR